MHATKMRSSASAATASTTPARRPRPTAASISVSPSRPAVSRGVSPGATAAAAGLAGRGRSLSPSTAKNARGEDAGTVVSGTATHLGSAAPTGASLSHFAHDGARFEPHAYETTFSFRGHYAHMTVAHGTATLWCANAATGSMDLYSCVTGQHVTSLPPLHEEVAARRAELAELPINAPSSKSTASPRSRGLVGVGGSGAGRRPSLSLPSCGIGATPPPPQMSGPPLPASEVRASALCATSAHVWVGYTDGSVAVYDALLLKLLSVGHFHGARVVAVAALRSGQTVSASADGLLVLWDTEQAGFEAVTRLTVLQQEAAQDGAGLLCAMVAAPDAARVCCGFESGHVYVLAVAGRAHEQTAPHLLRGHHGRLNDMAAVRDLLFTAAEDGSVCVWHCGAAVAPGRTRGNSTASNHNALTAPTTPRAQWGAGTAKLLKRVPVKPNVRCLLAEPQTGSVWVAYADGLMERWSANPDDDYGVEEVVENATTTAIAAASSAGTGGGVHALLSLSAVQTMQWLALSSNGVNKVWYGHKNTLEINLAHAITTLAQVVEQDTEDAAAWRERASLLAQKELERRHKYICILEQLNEQRVLMRHYDMWKRAVLFCGTRRRRRTALAETLATRARVRLARAYFGTWASFYDAQQRHMRGYVLSMALSRATEQQQLHGYLLRWQAFVVRRQLRHTAERHATLLARLLDVATLGGYFRRWRAAAAATGHRQVRCVTDEQLALLASKAQRQVLQRVLRRWLAHHEDHHHDHDGTTAEGSWTPTWGLRGEHDRQARAAAAAPVSAIARFAAHYAREVQQRQARQALLRWRRWTERRARFASLAAVAALREQQLRYEARQRFFLQWRQRVHARHAAANTAQLKALEVALHRAEAEHGDIFERLQLQRQLDTLQHRQAAEEAQLAQIKTQLAAAEQNRADLHARPHPPRQGDGNGNGSAAGGGGGDGGAAAWRACNNGSGLSAHGGGAVPGVSHSIASQSTSAAAAGGGGGVPQSVPQQQPPPSQALLSSTSRGHMAQHAAWYRGLVDQQRLSPIVLAHMPMEDAVHHVMGQLKGNVVNLYTDLALFRQVKDRRRAGTSAVGILLEAFGEIKRLIVTTVRGGSANAAPAAAARMGGKATRWPLSMEALDCIPVHHCASVLSAIKTLVVAYDLLQPDDVAGVQTTCEELVVNADWIFLIARACYLRRKPVPPVNNRQVV